MASFNQWFYWGLENYARTQGYFASLTLRPTDALRISLAPSVNHSRNDLQYITTANHISGDSYVLGTVDQEIYRMTIRANYNLTPNLTLELWGQPFLASGRYSNFKEATATTHEEFGNRFDLLESEIVEFSPDDNQYLISKDGSTAPTYSFDNPDFNVREFRSNLVMRWEYIPGSTLFLVWSSNGSAFDQDERIGFNEVSKDYFKLDSRNTFLLKYTYRFIL
jgi:hypothetical protein